jgi:hypothetical protein
MKIASLIVASALATGGVASSASAQWVGFNVQLGVPAPAYVYSPPPAYYYAPPPRVVYAPPAYYYEPVRYRHWHHHHHDYRSYNGW